MVQNCLCCQDSEKNEANELNLKMADTFVEIMINHFTFTREGVRTCGPEAVLTHHLCLGVAMAGVQAVGATSHRLAWPHWGGSREPLQGGQSPAPGTCT